MPEHLVDRPTIGSVIVHYEAPDELELSVRSLQAGSRPPDRILIVDNSESASAREEAQALASELDVEYLGMKENVGFGAGCNVGVEHLVDCNQILLLNQDAVVESDCLEQLSASLDAHPSVAAINPRIEHANQRVWFAGGTFTSSLARLTIPGQGEPSDHAINRTGALTPTEWANGCALLLRRSAYVDQGGFDERFFMYWEDVDLSLRLIDAGWELGVDLAALAIHDQGNEGSTKLTTTVIEHSIRSRMLFIRLRLTGPDRWTASAYTAVNVLGLVATSIGRHGLRSRPQLQSVIAGLRPRTSDGDR